MQIRWLFVYAGVLALTTGDPVPQICTVPPSHGTLNDLTGSTMYLKHYNVNTTINPNTFTVTHPIFQNKDSFTFNFKKLEGTENQYKVDFVKIHKNGVRKTVSQRWTQHASEQMLKCNNGTFHYYSIPYLKIHKENVSAVFYMCLSFSPVDTTEIVLVLTTNLDNDLTKALEAANKLVDTRLVQLPFKHKDKL